MIVLLITDANIKLFWFTLISMHSCFEVDLKESTMGTPIYIHKGTVGGARAVQGTAVSRLLVVQGLPRLCRSAAFLFQDSAAAAEFASHADPVSFCGEAHVHQLRILLDH